MLHAGVPSSDNFQQGDAAASESAVEQACERLILETVRLLQEGQLEQADALLMEGAVSSMQTLSMCCDLSFTVLLRPLRLPESQGTYVIWEMSKCIFSSSGNA